MSLFNRVKNIVRSNINAEKEPDIDISASFDEFYFDNADEMPKDNVEQKYYSVLELPYGSGFPEIKKAYKKLLRKYHPDFFTGNPKKQEVAKEVTKKINEAFSYFENKYLE